MDGFAARFAADFGGLKLPPGVAEACAPGLVDGAGWRIRYVFGRDDRSSLLDYLASHRMTNPLHGRLRATGEAASLPCTHEMLARDGTPESKERAEAEYRAHNRRIGEMLTRKGLAG